MGLKDKFSLSNIVNLFKNKIWPWVKKNRYLLISLLIGVIIFILGIILSFFHKDIGSIIEIIGCILVIIVAFATILMQLLKDPEILITIIALGIGLTVLSISIGQGILKIVNDCFLKEDKVAMIGYYSSLISGVFSGIIGVAGAIIGTKIGADKSYKAAMDSISKQIEYDREKLNKEKEEEKNKAQQIIDSLLKYEITYNFNKLIVFDTQNRNILINHFKNKNTVNGLYNYLSSEDIKRNCCFRFDEFNNIKYTYLNYMSEEIVHIYQMFRILEDKKLFINLNQNEYEYVASTYLKYYDKYIG